jgi:hypothetical protein
MGNAARGVAVQQQGTDVNNTRSGGVCFAGIRIGNDGVEYDHNNIGSPEAVVRGTWLLRGTTSDVWVERTINSGTLNVTDDLSSGRQATTTDRDLVMSDSTDDSNPVTTNITLRFYDASSGGNLLSTATFDLIAERLP